MTIFPDLTALIVSAIVVFLAVALKNWFFEPLAQVVEEREGRYQKSASERRKEEGRLAASETALSKALAEARQAGYAEMDRVRNEAGENADRLLAEARERARQRLAEGMAALAEQTAAAEAELDRAAGGLAESLTTRLLRRAS